MSARGFGSVLWAGAVAGAALGFYLVSLRVASERAALEDVETEIALAQRDIRLLQTEIGTRGRLAQLERWNVKFIRLSAPTADQFVEGGFQLATLVAPEKRPAIEAPMVLASARIDPSAQRTRVSSDSDGMQVISRPSRPASEMVHVASYSVPQSPITSRPRLLAPPPAIKPPPAIRPQTAKPDASVTSRPARDGAATKLVKTATADPLAPLPTAKPRAKGGATAATAAAPAKKRTLKDSDD